MMQSSGSNTQRKDDYQLVSRLVQYAFRVFNLDMNGFFMKYCDVFDQTPAEMKKNGETLEQYEAFRKCVREAVRLRGRAWGWRGGIVAKAQPAAFIVRTGEGARRNILRAL